MDPGANLCLYERSWCTNVYPKVTKIQIADGKYIVAREWGVHPIFGHGAVLDSRTGKGNIISFNRLRELAYPYWDEDNVLWWFFKRNDFTHVKWITVEANGLHWVEPFDPMSSDSWYPRTKLPSADPQLTGLTNVFANVGIVDNVATLA